jgi:hypothetical protein
MGGQACVLYGAAEFSRDVDLAILLDAANLAVFEDVLDDLQAVKIAVPPFEPDYLRRGHAVHFRCGHVDAEGIRLDIMSTMRGVDPFTSLWERRTTLQADGDVYEVMSLPDLVKAKKTQRDKDWPMIRRLVEASYFSNRVNPTAERVSFWLCELRTTELLIEAAYAHPAEAERLIKDRPLLQHAMNGSADQLAEGIAQEEQLEREKDRIYWAPLRRELEALRHSNRKREDLDGQQ